MKRREGKVTVVTGGAQGIGREPVPYGRMGTPADLVGAAVFLASAEADDIVAQTLNFDGGNWMS